MNTTSIEHSLMVEQVKTLLNSGLFDIDYYCSSYPDVVASGIHPIEHYVRFGSAEKRNPNKDFNAAAYASTHRLPTDINPLLHYIQNLNDMTKDALSFSSSVSESHGQENEYPTRLKKIIDTGLVDTAWYLAEHKQLETLSQLTSTDPSYAVAAHYLQHCDDGVKPCEHFDPDYYLKAYPDVAKSGSDPLLHFCEFGWRELRNPSDTFDTGWYWLVHQQNDSRELNPLIHYREIGRVSNLDFKPATKSRLSQLDEACKRLIAHKPPVNLCISVSYYLQKLGRHANAELVYSYICNIDRSPEHLDILCDLYSKQKKWWQALDAIRSACEEDAKDARRFAKMGEICDRLNRHAEAIRSYEKALESDVTTEHWQYRLGFLYERTGDFEKADKIYKVIIKQSGDSAVRLFGIGVFHQARGLWKDAAIAYARNVLGDPLNPELHYRLGMAYDRCFEWRLAAASYQLAISLGAKTPYWLYRLGFVLERAGELNKSAQAYGAAASLSKKHESYWFYRQGCVLQQAGDFENACHAYVNTVKQAQAVIALNSSSENPKNPGDATDIKKQAETAEIKYINSFSRAKAVGEILSEHLSNTNIHAEYGKELELSNEWALAAKAYSSAISRAESHASSWNYQLGRCLMKLAKYEDACEAFSNTRIIKKAYGFDYSKYEKNVSIKNSIEYNEIIETTEISANVILYESYHGASVSCSPYAIFKELLNNPSYCNIIHVWAINDLNKAPKAYTNIENVIFIQRNSYRYRYYVATAKYLINNNTFMPWFVRRPEQKYLNTWHGTPMKGLGKDIKSSFMSHKNVTRNFLHSTHLISPNRHTTEVMISRHDILGNYRGMIAETGYPRNDRVLERNATEQEQLASLLKLNPAKKTVLYAPTWRGTTAAPLLDIERLIYDLAELSNLDCNLLFRGHHMSEEKIAAYGMKSVSNTVETSELLSITDILITDYSSICFDFMPTGRPVLYYVYDYDSYSEERGLYLEIENLPGVVVHDIEKLCASITALCTQPIVRIALDSSSTYLDMSAGYATQRAINFLFNNDPTYTSSINVDNRKAILIYAGSLPANGITQSCISLIKAIDPSKFRIVLVIDPDTIEVEQYRIAKLNEVSADIQIISRVGNMNLSPEEKLVVDIFNAQNTLYSEAMWKIYCIAMSKEFNRIFGNSEFEVIIQFEGYGKFWSSVLAHGNPHAKKIMYLHNNMIEEFNTKYEFLEGIFNLYPFYTKLVSVSDSVNSQNITSLSDRFKLDPTKFAYCDNYVDINVIKAKSMIPLDSDICTWVGNACVFGTVGRLSPEKGHYKLIQAFNEIIKNNDIDIRLVIVGDGPQWATLQRLIDDLNLSEFVLLAGVRQNPYPIIKSFDLFVFSSDHEGQGLAIIEALILRRPVLSTDIPGPHSILAPGYGKLVPNSVEGLIQGMQSYIDNNFTFTAFNPQNYVANVDRMFGSLIQ